MLWLRAVLLSRAKEEARRAEREEQEKQEHAERQERERQESARQAEEAVRQVGWPARIVIGLVNAMCFAILCFKGIPPSF